jgi:hypothetical protein
MGHSKWVGACALAAACYLGGQIIAQEPAADDPFGGVAPGAPPAVSDAADPFATERSAQTLVDAYGNPIELGRGAAETSDRAAYQSAQRRIESALGQRLKSPLDFPETPLSIIMQVLSDEYEFPILFDTMALEAIAQSPETEVTAAYSNITLRSALELLLGQCEDLAYIIDDEVLLITSEDEAETRLEVLVYRVDDLVSRHPDGDAIPLDADYDDLIEVIVGSVESDSWEATGSGEGTIIPYKPGMLVVTQTRRVHEQVSTLLDMLRNTKAAVLSGAVPSEQPSVLTRGFRIFDSSLAEDVTARDAIRDVLMRSANWEDTGDQLAEETSLYVLPQQVIVRHRPSVIRQVQQTLRDLGLTVPENPGNSSGVAMEDNPTRQGRRGGF